MLSPVHVSNQKLLDAQVTLYPNVLTSDSVSINDVGIISVQSYWTAQAAIAASYNGLFNVEGGGTDTLTVVCATPGAAGNKTITGDGVKTCATLIGAGYTITAGGAVVLKSGDEIVITGGYDARTGAIAIQVSNDNVNFTTLDSQSVGATASSVIYNLSPVGYSYIRAKYTSTQGGGGLITTTLNTKVF